MHRNILEISEIRRCKRSHHFWAAMWQLWPSNEMYVCKNCSTWIHSRKNTYSFLLWHICQTHNFTFRKVPNSKENDDSDAPVFKLSKLFGWLQKAKKKSNMRYIPHKRQLKTKRKQKNQTALNRFRGTKVCFLSMALPWNISIMKSFPDNLIFFKNGKPVFILHWSVSCVH